MHDHSYTVCTLSCNFAIIYEHCSVYFESVTWADLSVGFETVPGGEAYRNRSVLSYHFYEPPQVTANCNLNSSIVQTVFC